MEGCRTRRCHPTRTFAFYLLETNAVCYCVAMSTSLSPEPILFIDVDGVLNRLTPPSTGAVAPHSGCAPFGLNLSQGHGPALLALTDRFELVWATMWMEQANEYIGPAIGLPELPWVDFSGWDAKAGALQEYAGDRPFVWLDDAPLQDDCERLTVGQFLITVEPEEGLMHDHLIQADLLMRHHQRR